MIIKTDWNDRDIPDNRTRSFINVTAQNNAKFEDVYFVPKYERIIIKFRLRGMFYPKRPWTESRAEIMCTLFLVQVSSRRLKYHYFTISYNKNTTKTENTLERFTWISVGVLNLLYFHTFFKLQQSLTKGQEQNLIKKRSEGYFKVPLSDVLCINKAQCLFPQCKNRLRGWKPVNGPSWFFPSPFVNYSYLLIPFKSMTWTRIVDQMFYKYNALHC